MSNKITTLDWLAINVSDWGDAFTALVSSQSARYHSVSYCQERMDFTGADCDSITKCQWLARRAELQGEIESAKACADGGLAGPVAAAFKPITSIEDNQELNMTQQQEVKQNDGWFERGELPPVGVECEFRHPVFGWTGCDVVGHYRLHAVCAPNGGEFYGGGIDRFRPIRTERELAIEEMVSVMVATKRANLDINAEALYDAGYRKDPK